jgi:hypothetical protein
LSRAAFEMERSGKAGDTETLAHWMPELETRFERMKTAMEGVMGTKKIPEIEPQMDTDRVYLAYKKRMRGCLIGFA